MGRIVGQRGQEGFSLVELLVVVVIIGIVAAIGFPRLLSQRQAAKDAMAVSDLRNLVAVEISLSADGYSQSRVELADEGWAASDPLVTVCAQVVNPMQLVLTSWHESGSTVYSWQSTEPRVASDEGVLPTSCLEAMGPLAEEVS